MVSVDPFEMTNTKNPVENEMIRGTLVAQLVERVPHVQRLCLSYQMKAQKISGGKKGKKKYALISGTDYFKALTSYH